MVVQSGPKEVIKNRSEERNRESWILEKNCFMELISKFYIISYS